MGLKSITLNLGLRCSLSRIFYTFSSKIGCRFLSHFQLYVDMTMNFHTDDNTKLATKRINSLYMSIGISSATPTGTDLEKFPTIINSFKNMDDIYHFTKPLYKNSSTFNSCITNADFVGTNIK